MYGYQAKNNNSETRKIIFGSQLCETCLSVEAEVGMFNKLISTRVITIDQVKAGSNIASRVNNRCVLHFIIVKSKKAKPLS